MTPYGRIEQVGSSECLPIEPHLHRSGAAPERLSAQSPFAARSWPTGPFQALLALLAGAAFGPQGLAFLTPRVLAFIDPAAPVAVAMLGVVAGLSLRTDRPNRCLVAAAQVPAMVTAIMVAAGVLAFGPTVITVSPITPWWMVALVLGISAATSSSLPPDATDVSREITLGPDAHDYLLPIVLGGVLLAFMREGSPAAALALAVQGTAIAGVIAIAGWLLLSQASTTAEQRVVLFASLLLLGGAADYLSTSALLGGLAAGAGWHFAGGAVREYVRRDVAYVQHSLLVLVLLLAGARADFSPAALIVGIAYIVVRTIGKLLGGGLATRLSAAVPRDTTARLISPGVFGVAFALNVARTAGADFAPVLTVVVVGTIASSLIAASGHSRATEP